MRLNWSNIGKGLEAIADAKIARDVASAGSQIPRVTEGAYGPQLEDNLKQVQGLRNQAIEKITYDTGGDEAAIAEVEAQYAPAIEELKRRSGLTQADYSVGGSPNYASRERALAEQGLMRAQKEAEAYRKVGMVDKATEVENAALSRKLQLTQEDRAIAAEQRAVDEADREGKRFTTEQAAREIGLERTRRDEAQVAALDAFDKLLADLPKEQRTEENMRRLASQAGLNRDSQLKVYARELQIGENEIAAMDQYVEGVLRKNPTLKGVLKAYKSDSRLDPDTHVVSSVDPKTGAVTLTQVKTLEGGKDGEPIMTLGTFPNEAVALSQLRAQAKDPSALAKWTMDERTRAREDKQLENDVERLNIAKKSLNLDQKRFLETQAVNDRDKLRNIQRDGLDKRLTEAQIKNVQAETLLRETKAAGQLTEDDILSATLRLMTADPELDPKTAAKRVRAAAEAIKQDDAALQAAALKRLQEVNAARSGGRPQQAPPQPVGLQ